MSESVSRDRNLGRYSLRSRRNSTNADDRRNEGNDDDEDDVGEEIQTQLDRLLGTDSDSDKSFAPEVSDEEDSDIEKLRSLHRVSPKAVKRKETNKIIETKSKRDYRADSKYPRELKCIPSEVKKITDNFLLDNDPDSRFDSHAPTHMARVRKLLTEEMISMLPDEDPESCCEILIEFMRLPREFWMAPDQNPRSIEAGHDKTRGHEEVGLVVLQVLERLISNRSLYLQTVLKIGKIVMKWRRSHIERGRKPKISKRARKPKTFLKCCDLLISAGDLSGLKELFQDYEPVRGEMETEVGVVRCVVEMMNRGSVEAGADDASVGGSSSVASGLGQFPTAAIIQCLSSAVRDPASRPEWFLPLLTDFMQEHEGSEAVRSLLTEYRDLNMAHLPAHLLLTDYLLRQYQDRQHLILPELRLLCEKFPFQTKEVIEYCQILVKSSEDSDLEDSFESTEVAPDSSKDKSELYREVLTAVANCLDFPSNNSEEVNLQIWTFFAESVKYLNSRHQENREFVRTLFQAKNYWWFKQNFELDKTTTDKILIKKSIVSLILCGAESESFRKLESGITQRGEEANEANYNQLKILLKELQFVRTNHSIPFLTEVQNRAVTDDDFVRSEWKKIRAKVRKED